MRLGRSFAFRWCGGLAAAALLVLVTPLVSAASGAVSLRHIDASAYPSVRATVRVTSSEGAPVAGLDRTAFTVLEDGAPVAADVKAVVDNREPIAAAVLLDASGSMAVNGRLDAAKAIVASFIDSMGPADTAALLSFSEQLRLHQSFTADRAALHNALGAIQARGNTALQDGLSYALLALDADASKAKLLVLLSDGEENFSRQPLRTVLTQVQASGVSVMVIGIGSTPFRDLLDQVAAAGRGQAFHDATPAQLAEGFAAVRNQLRAAYELSYTSPRPAESASRRLTVRVSWDGSTAESEGSFTIEGRPPKLEITGLADLTRVAGVVTVTAVVTEGTARSVALLVDGQPIAMSSSAPYVLRWDTAAERTGLHRVTVQATDAAGRTAERSYVVEVIRTAAPASAAEGGNPWPAVGIVAVLLAIGAAVGFVAVRRSAAPPPAPPVDEPFLDPDDTEELTDAASQPEHTAASAAPAAPARLRVLEPNGGAEFVLTGEETVLGREPSNAIALADHLASRKHARIVADAGEYWLEDLGSLNGTFVNGTPVTRCKLASGDRVTVGGTTLVFSLDEPATPAPPSETLSVPAGVGPTSAPLP